jgi:hypothetical protein
MRFKIESRDCTTTTTTRRRRRRRLRGDEIRWTRGRIGGTRRRANDATTNGLKIASV